MHLLNTRNAACRAVQFRPYHLATSALCSTTKFSTEPNAEVGAVHPKAVPEVLTTHDACDTSLAAPVAEALQLQRPLPDGALRVVARRERRETCRRRWRLRCYCDRDPVLRGAVYIIARPDGL